MYFIAGIAAAEDWLDCQCFILSANVAAVLVRQE